MNEALIYKYAKLWFESHGYIALAGQPPNGCDHIPTIEIKDSSNTTKGSKGSFKPDLLVANLNSVFLIECKPKYSKSDELKLLSIKNNQVRIDLLFNELTQRNIFKRANLDIFFSNKNEFSAKICYCLANNTMRAHRKLYNLKVAETIEVSVLLIPNIL